MVIRNIQLFLRIVLTHISCLLLIKSLKFIISSLFVNSYLFEMAHNNSMYIHEISHIGKHAERNSHNSSIYTFELCPFDLRTKKLFLRRIYIHFKNVLELCVCVCVCARTRARQGKGERARCSHPVACNCKSCDK